MAITAGNTVPVTAHGNSLRALVKHLDGISDAEIAELNIPAGIPLGTDRGRALPRLHAGVPIPQKKEPH